MDTLTRIALVGTSKSAGTAIDEHPADGLLIGHVGDDEETLLLRAGVRAVFDESGRLPAPNVPLVSPSPPEEEACGSARLAGLLQNALTSSSRELLIEFLRQMQRCRLVLPHELLPQALAVADTEIRGLLLPVLGERGRWLAGFRSEWSWVQSGTATVSGGDSEFREAVWAHGSIRERCSALTTIRQTDPAEGRVALEETLAQEKADHRTQLLATLEHGLSREDESLLESCLDDRSSQVKEVAASLLSRLPESALSIRMRERADAMLELTQSGRILKRQKLVCSPPETIDRRWNRDGVASKAPSGRGKRAYWAEAVLRAIPPSHWSDKFDLDATALISAVEDDSFENAMLAAWTQAAARFAMADPRSADWLVPLWTCWVKRAGGAGDQGQAEAYRHLETVLPRIPRDQAEALLLRELERCRRNEATEPLSLLSLLERPWSADFAAGYLSLTRKVLQSTSDNTGCQWANTLLVAARAVPRETFADALKPWDVKNADQSSWHVQSIVRETDRFADTVNTRRMFYEELPLT